MEEIIKSRCFRFLIFAFIISIIIGYLGATEESAKSFIQSFMESKEFLFKDNGQISPLALFKNNVLASLFMFLGGLIPFLFLPFIFLLVNGHIIGLALKYSAIKGASPFKVFVFGILPHGVFELTAIFLSVTMGIYLCFHLSKKILKKEYLPIKTLFKKYLMIFLTKVVPLLVLAAFAEVYLTPMLLQ
ncbi:MAG: stage II sporulation protein M [Tissierellia bacterium]|nr:stage II sporulation protein M [Tissierellia bacterium]